MDKSNALEPGAVQMAVAKATGLTASSTFIFGWTINQFVAVGGLVIALAGFFFQVWLGRKRLEIERIAAGINNLDVKMDEVQTELHAVQDCLQDDTSRHQE